MSGQSSPRTAGGAPTQPSSKSAAAPAKLSSEVEMDDLPGTAGDGAPKGAANGVAGGPATAPESDIMQLARIGDIAAMEKLFESGEFDATYSDEEGITPLHWAAINNQYAMCRFLIERGANVNAKGGESVATPLQWAAQRCHYYTVNLLLQHGADPLITDAQGYNTLHISTFNGNVLLLVLLLHQGIPVDVLDAFGHTGLMWSAYKGYPACVDVFLRWGASVHAADEQGFTALHWALVKGSPGCIQKLIEYGADRFAKTTTGKTPAITAKELNTLGAWHRALKECGYDEDGHPITPAWPFANYFLQDRRGFTTKFLFLWPFVLVWAVIFILSGMVIYAAVPIAAVVGYAIQWVAQQVLEHAPPDMRHFHKTPWLAGIFAGSLFLVGVNWLFTILPATFASHTLLNMIFAAFFSLTAYFYITTMVYDPGFVPKLNGIAEQKAVIDELLSQWKFDESNFCVTCMIRSPLRSKHCRRCQRCVAKHDHHCPWVHNCVGINNHRNFFLYIICMTIGIIVYDWILYYYFTVVTAGASSECNLLGPSACEVVNSDAYTLLLAIWISLQLTWVTMLLFVQFIQVSRGMTTYENMYGIQDASVASLQSAYTSTGTPLDPTLAAAHGHNPPSGSDGGAHAGHAHGHKHKGGFLSQWSRLLGVDTFIETATGRGAATASKSSSNAAARKKARKNPYSRGVLTNCRDFWCDPAPVFGRRDNGAAIIGGQPINWTDVYETPRAMDFGSGAGRRRAGGYEAVAVDEV